jgi:hypothetical protein
MSYKKLIFLFDDVIEKNIFKHFYLVFYHCKTRPFFAHFKNLSIKFSLILSSCYLLNCHPKPLQIFDAQVPILT